MEDNSIVIDANGAIFGRLAAYVAKEALKGRKVVVINAEKAVLSGNPDYHIKMMAWRRSFKNKADPDRSPKWPKVPHLLFKRMLRGMLPWKTDRGRRAFKNIMVYEGNPGYDNAQRLEDAVKDFAQKITLGELCRRFGWQ